MRDGRQITLICIEEELPCTTPTKIIIAGKAIEIFPAPIIQNISGRKIMSMRGRPPGTFQTFVLDMLKNFFPRKFIPNEKNAEQVKNDLWNELTIFDFDRI